MIWNISQCNEIQTQKWTELQAENRLNKHFLDKKIESAHASCE